MHNIAFLLMSGLSISSPNCMQDVDTRQIIRSQALVERKSELRIWRAGTLARAECVRLEFSISVAGKAYAVWIAETSFSRRLDDAALIAIHRYEFLPQPESDERFTLVFSEIIQ